MRLFTWCAGMSAIALATVNLAGCGNSASAPPQAEPASAAVGAAPAAAAIAAAPVLVPAPGADPVAASPAGSATARPVPAAPAARPTPATTPRSTMSAPASPPAPAAVEPAPAPARSVPPAPVFTEITVPSGTTLSIELTTGHASDASRVEDTVRGVLRRPLLVNGQEVAPAGASVTGHVTAAEQAGKVKGRARLVLRFSSLVIDDAETPIATVAIAREAASTKKDDAGKIGIGAGAGAVIGAIAGGKKGAIVGGTIGAGAGTGVVLATRGDEVHLPAGTAVSTTLSQPLVVRTRLP